MTTDTLFDISALIATPQKKRVSVNTCRACEYIYRHEYGQMKYCRKQKDPRTSYGHKKIKSRDAACVMFVKSTT